MSVVSSKRAVASRSSGRSDVILIGFQDHENLGIGYLASSMRKRGYSVSILDFKASFETTLATIRDAQPVLVGFSLIFQFYVRRFAELVHFLRANGVTCHFTIGGHFPSLSYEQTLKLIPELDSVVRFEGEATLAQLVEALDHGDDWRSLNGLAYRRGDEIVTNPLQSLIRDLDLLPYPERPNRPQAILGRRIALMLASRGCARTCSFCSIHVFYRSAPGKVVRTRKPIEVVREMLSLYRERQVSIFSFQDDDFPLFGSVWRRWTREFLVELRRCGLANRIIWKISCRADSVEEELFREMKEAGLYFVYIGIESGSEAGLEEFNKKTSVEKNLRAVEILKRLGLVCEYGFMMFSPSTTFASIKENVTFLRDVAGDGSTAISFCRMLPYDGTPIKESLARSGRLHGDVCSPDYDFLDPTVTEYFHLITNLLERVGWMDGEIGLSQQLKVAFNEAAVMQRLFPTLPDFPYYLERLRTIARESNEIIFSVVEDLMVFVTEGRLHNWTRERLRTAGYEFLAAFRCERDGFVSKHQQHFMSALGASTFELQATG
jgi:radical SAM superfamily enzyme YgiQ (UPF0313 family)